jgi:hypothetical protein
MTLHEFAGRMECCPLCQNVVRPRMGRYRGQACLQFYCLVCREQFILNRATSYRWVLESTTHRRA